MQCPKCAGELPESSRYCHHCHSLFKPVPDEAPSAADHSGEADAPARALKSPGYTLFSPKGRVNRLKYLYSSLIAYLGQVLLFIGFTLYLANGENSWLSVVLVAIVPVLALAQIMAIVKRFHDMGKPGSRFLLLLIPLYNIYLSFVLLLQESEPGENGYGPTERNSWYWQVPLTMLAVPVLFLVAAGLLH